MIQLIAETERWLVFNKPAGWLTIPAARSSLPVLLTWATEKFGRLWVVHRLDLETSGVILFARSAEAHRQANLWFSAHRVRKTYHCLARGVPSTPVFRINVPIEGVRCVTQVEVLERYGSGADAGFLAAVMPLTGRRHQIRIHLSSQGFPLWGDPRYSGPTRVSVQGAELEIPRVALHASKLELPGTNNATEKFEAPWPPDFTAWVGRARK